MIKQKMTKWLENVYNCPYLILIMVSSVVAMLSFDEIGIRVMNHIMTQDRTVSVVGDIVKAEEHQTQGEVPVIVEEIQDTGIQDALNQNVVSENLQDELQNAGERKEETGGIENINKLNIEVEKSETLEKQEELVKGTTKFLPYTPLEIESRYYSDAGKIALTTEYPYTLENDSYFNDAAFLGDSRTLGIYDYVGLDGADFFCDNGMTIFKLLKDDGVTEQGTGQKVDLKKVLQERHYGKIYIMLGMNELGYGNTTMYLQEYMSVLKQIREWQPEATIFIMANLHISREKNNMATEFNNININDKNVACARLANGTDIFYLDSNPMFTDNEGFLLSELTFDGVHLYAKHYDKWRQFLMEHGVERGDSAAVAVPPVEETVISDTDAVGAVESMEGVQAVDAAPAEGTQ